MKKVKFNIPDEYAVVAHHNVSALKDKDGVLYGKTDKPNDCAVMVRKVVNTELFDPIYCFDTVDAEVVPPKKRGEDNDE